MIFNIFSCLLLAVAGALPTGDASSAGTAYRWTDAQGQTHYGDHPPEHGASALPLREPVQAAPVQGLREGERQVLRGYEKRRKRLRAAASERRAQANRIQERRLADCRETRDRLHDTRDRDRRKQYTARLRAHCW